MSGMRLRRWGAALACCLFCVVAASAPASDDKPATDQPQPKFIPPENQLTVDQLIDALGSPNYDERQQATDILKAKKKSFTDELSRLYRLEQDHEIRLRLVEVAEFLFYKEALQGMGGFLGIQMDTAAPSKRVRGVRVLRAIPGRAAEKGDIRAGDIIIAIDGKALLSNDDSTLDERRTIRQLTGALMTAISSVQPGADMTATILRDGDELTAKVTLGLKPLSLVRQMLDLGRLDSDHRAALESSSQDFTRWRAELENSP